MPSIDEIKDPKVYETMKKILPSSSTSPSIMEEKKKDESDFVTVEYSKLKVYDKTKSPLLIDDEDYDQQKEECDKSDNNNNTTQCRQM